MSTSRCKYFSLIVGFLLVGFLLFSCGRNQKCEKFDKAAKLVSYFEPATGEYEHLFVISNYQCAGCVDSMMTILASNDFRSLMKSSFWISPYEKPNCLNMVKSSQWLLADQEVIERFLPYAANITYIKYDQGGVSECRELGIEMLEVKKLKELLNP